MTALRMTMAQLYAMHALMTKYYMTTNATQIVLKVHIKLAQKVVLNAANHALNVNQKNNAKSAMKASYFLMENVFHHVQ